MIPKIKVAEKFEPLFINKVQNFILRGPRINGKTTAARQDCFIALISEIGDIVVANYQESNQRLGFYAEMQEEIYNQGTEHLFKFGAQPLQIEYLKNGNTMHFTAYGGGQNRSKGFKTKRKLSRIVFEELSQCRTEIEFKQARASYLRHLKPDGKVISIYNPENQVAYWIDRWYDYCSIQDDYCCLFSTYKDISKFLDKNTLAEIEQLKNTDFELYRYMYEGVITGMSLLAVPTFDRNKHLLNIEQFREFLRESNKRLIAIIVGGDNSVSHDKTGLVPFFCFSDGTTAIVDIFYYDPLTAGAIDTTNMSKYMMIWLTYLFENYKLMNHYSTNPFTGQYESFLPIYITIDCATIGKELVMQLNKTIALTQFSNYVSVVEFTKKSIHANNAVLRAAFRLNKIFIVDSGGYIDFATMRFKQSENLLVKQLETVIWKDEKRKEFLKSIENDIFDGCTYAAYSIFSSSVDVIPQFKLPDIFNLKNQAIELT